MSNNQNEISKEEAYNKNFGLEDQEMTEYEKNEILAEEKYSTNNILEISYKNAPLFIFYKIMKGLLTPKTNHIATHAIIEGSIFEKRLMRKLLAFSLLPFLSIMLSVILIGTMVSGVNTENIKVNLTTIGISLGIFLFMWLIIYSFIFIKSHIFEKLSKHLFKTNVNRISIQVLLVYWTAITLTTSLLSWVFSILASLSMPLVGTSIAFFLHLILFILIIWMFHKSLAYALRIKTYKFILLNSIIYVILLSIIYLITILI